MDDSLLTMYDYLNPGLATLQQLSINAVTVQLWRWKLEKHRTKNTMHQLYPSFIPYGDLPLKRLMPEMPPAIYHLIEEYVKKFGLSLQDWLCERFYSHLFKIFHENVTDILKLFDDFVCGKNGTIHKVCTAKRMMLCDRISQQEKFQIACEYCFEDDIRLIWPSVSNQLQRSTLVNGNRILERYWVGRIVNRLSRESKRKYFRRGYPTYSIDEEEVLLECPPHAWSSFKYFWHRITIESQWRVVTRMFSERKRDFVKFILPMLNEDQLDKFVTENGLVWVCDLFKNDKEKYYYSSFSFHKDDEIHMCVLSTWTYLSNKNKIYERHFVELMKKMFDTETKHHIVKDALNDTDKRSYYDQNKFYHGLETICFCEIWSSAPLNLSATEHILRGKRLTQRSEWSPFEARETGFLMKILSDATMETRKAFWNENWYYLITCTRLQDSQQIIELCFENENEISQFKENVLSKYENVDNYCCKLFQKCCFKKLDSFFTFCCPEKRKRKLLKQQFLQSNFLGQNCIFSTFDHLEHCHAINEFIEDAYENADLAIEFKKQFTSLPRIQRALVKFVPAGSFSELMKFVDTFVVTDETAKKLKVDFTDHLRSGLVNGTQGLITADKLQKFFVWSLGDSDEVIKFKKSISPVKVVHNTKRNKNYYSNTNDSHHNFNVFLEWYFSTTDEIEQFKKKYFDVIEKFSSEKTN